MYIDKSEKIFYDYEAEERWYQFAIEDFNSDGELELIIWKESFFEKEIETDYSGLEIFRYESDSNSIFKIGSRYGIDSEVKFYDNGVFLCDATCFYGKEETLSDVYGFIDGIGTLEINMLPDGDEWYEYSEYSERSFGIYMKLNDASDDMYTITIYDEYSSRDNAITLDEYSKYYNRITSGSIIYPTYYYFNQDEIERYCGINGNKIKITHNLNRLLNFIKENIDYCRYKYSKDGKIL